MIRRQAAALVANTITRSAASATVRLHASRSVLAYVGLSVTGIASLALYDRSTFKLGNSFSTSSRAAMSSSDYPIQKSDAEWRAQLSPEQFRILRKKGTEMAGTGEYNTFQPKSGVFNCVGCGNPLYSWDSKKPSHCGWPSMMRSLPGAVTRHEDRTFGMVRTEIVCAKCGGHLGHVFKGEGWGAPEDERHCVNSVSIVFDDKEPPKAGEDGAAAAAAAGENKE